jgi:voltage-gated potassium channel
LCLALVILGLGGLGFWLIDPRVNSLGDGLWLAFTTAATVGYGDLVPSTTASRIFAVLVVLLGLAVLSLVTASLSAVLLQEEEREFEKKLMHELTHELKQLRAELAQSRSREASPSLLSDGARGD